MNERIKDLYLNSLDDKQNFCYQKFAELIVRECANLVVDDDNAFDILKHFGVE